MKAPRTSHSLRASLSAMVLLVAAWILVSTGDIRDAKADTVYQPSGTWNGKLIYLSRACHDGNDGVPGGDCIPNTGCDSFNENYNSGEAIKEAITNTSAGQLNLQLRGYRSILGNGTLGQNVANSNAAGADVHIPVHSNAKSESCGNTDNSGHGTWGMYRYANQETCATRIKNRLGSASPGTADITSYTTGLGELNNVNALACYIEAEFHTWRRGVDWLRLQSEWAWRIGYIVDLQLDYP